MVTSLEDLVKIFNHIYVDSTVQICDTELRFKFIGNKMLSAFDLSRDDVINKKLIDIKSPVKHLASRYNELNIPVLEGKSLSATYTTYVKTSNTFLLAKNLVKPIIVNDKIVGILIDTSIIHNILTFNLKAIKDKLNKETATIVTSSLENKLITFSDVEELIIFLILIGKLDKEISEILQRVGVYLSRSGVSKLITRKLFPKLSVSTRNQLIAQVFYQGLISKLPKLLLENKSLFNLAFRSLNS